MKQSNSQFPDGVILHKRSKLKINVFRSCWRLWVSCSILMTFFYLNKHPRRREQKSNVSCKDMSHSSNSAIFNSTPAKLLLKKKSSLFFHISSFLHQTAVCSENFCHAVALQQPWWRIWMYCEIEHGLELLRMLMSGPSTVAIKPLHRLLAELVMQEVAHAHW